jgi:hypothetical protein
MTATTAEEYKQLGTPKTFKCDPNYMEEVKLDQSMKSIKFKQGSKDFNKVICE